MKQLLSALLITLMSINFAYAISLQEAKSQGLVGERLDGYVGYVVTPPAAEVTAMVKEVNNKRRDTFQASAEKNGITPGQVGVLFYKRAVEATKSNQYYQGVDGSWVKK